LAIIHSASEEERAVLLNWAQQVMAIRSLDINVAQKVTRIISVTHQLGMTKTLLSHLLAEVQRVAWTDRGKPMRGVVGGVGVGLLASIGAPMAGVAAFGGAIAVPVVLLSAGAGALLMAIVDELQKGD
jgi:hypothetical protein